MSGLECSFLVRSGHQERMGATVGEGEDKRPRRRGYRDLDIRANQGNYQMCCSLGMPHSNETKVY